MARIRSWGATLAFGAIWWGVFARSVPEGIGAVEATVAAGGWGLSLLPVHCVPAPVRRGGSDGDEPAERGGSHGR